MSKIPDDIWTTRAQSILVIVSLALAMILGADIIYQDAIVNPPFDPATSGFGAFLLGAGPVRWFEKLKAPGAEK